MEKGVSGMAAACSSVSSGEMIRHSQLEIIPNVLPPEEGRKLFDVSRELFEKMKVGDARGRTGYLQDRLSKSSSGVLFQGKSTGESTEEHFPVSDYDDRSTHLLVYAKQTGETFQTFLGMVARLDRIVREKLGGFKEELYWSAKYYEPTSWHDDTSSLHGQKWHQDHEGAAMDMFLYYYRGNDSFPTFYAHRISEEERLQPQDYSKLKTQQSHEINPPNNSFLRFPNHLYLHRGGNTTFDQGKLLVTFWKMLN